MDSRLIRTPGVYLVGFMGSGKTTIGAALADELGWSFADLDDDIEAVAGRAITEIFERDGEPEFRRQEREALKRRVRGVQCSQPLVLALGGGAFAQAENVELLEDNGVTVWLDAPFETVRRRVGGQTHRPLARDPENFAALYEARRQAYERANFRIAIESDDPGAAVAAIMALRVFG